MPIVAQEAHRVALFTRLFVGDGGFVVRPRAEIALQWE